MSDLTPIETSFPLHEFSELTEEVLFVFHMQAQQFVYLNAAFERVWNLQRAGILLDASLLLKTVHEDDRYHVTEAFKALQADSQKRTVEFRIQAVDVGQKWIKLNAYVSGEEGNKTIVGIAIDITVERSYSDTLNKFNSKKNSILQILAHDLLGPLGNIQMSSKFLSQVSALNENQAVMEFLNIIISGSQRGINLIQDLINTEFLQTSESAFMKQRVDLVQKLINMIEQFRQSPVPIPRQIRFTTSLDELYVSIDESKFMQAINNLVSNAVKFTPDEGVIEITVAEPDAASILITVQDNGIGIPADLHPFLFDRFTKARRKGIHGEPTNGLGMSIIKTIVEWHNGRIWFESEEGKGTTFYVEIPKDM